MRAIRLVPPSSVEQHQEQLGKPAPVQDKPSTVDQRDEISFWSRQMSEHALFLHLGLEEPTLKQTAYYMHQQWEQNRRRWEQVDPTVAASEARYLAAELRAFKVQVYQTLLKGTWLGWLWPTFVDHTRRELDFFVSRLNGQSTVRKDTCEQLRFMAEHAAFAAHLLDPSEAQLIYAAMEQSGQIQGLQNKCEAETLENLMALSKNATEQLDQYFTGSGIGDLKRVRSVIHPVLAEHVVREGRRFIWFLRTTQP